MRYYKDFDWEGFLAGWVPKPGDIRIKDFTVVHAEGLANLHERVVALESRSSVSLTNGLPGRSLKDDDKIGPIILVDDSKGWPYTILVGENRYELVPVGFQARVDGFVAWVRTLGEYNWTSDQKAKIYAKLRELGLMKED